MISSYLPSSVVDGVPMLSASSAMVEGGAMNAVIQRLLGVTGDLLLFGVVLLTAFTSVAAEIVGVASVLFYDVFLTYLEEDSPGREFEV